jgi:hypothetical protein
MPHSDREHAHGSKKMHDLSWFIEEILQKLKAVNLLAARSVRCSNKTCCLQFRGLPLSISEPHVVYAADFERKRIRGWQVLPLRTLRVTSKPSWSGRNYRYRYGLRYCTCTVTHRARSGDLPVLDQSDPESDPSTTKPTGRLLVL